MQKYLRCTHVSNRFKERFGREFTALDRRKLLQMLKEGKASLVQDRDDKNKRLIFCYYEGVKSIFVLTKDLNFITYMRKD